MSEREKKISLFADALNVAVTDQGDGPAYLVLHGGAGPASVAGLAERLGQHGRVVVPTLPGFNGEPRPDWFLGVNDVVLAYLALVERLNLTKVVVVGNSFGGWIAAEMALRHSPSISGIALLNPVGIDTGSPDKAIVDPMKVAPADRIGLSFHDPKKSSFGVLTPAHLAVMAVNQQTLRLYGGEILHDPQLWGRLKGISVPALVGWGQSDKIVDVDYGRRWVQGIPGARFHAIPEAGHFPQIEQPDEVLRLLKEFRAGV